MQPTLADSTTNALAPAVPGRRHVAIAIPALAWWIIYLRYKEAIAVLIEQYTPKRSVYFLAYAPRVARSLVDGAGTRPHPSGRARGASSSRRAPPGSC